MAHARLPWIKENNLAQIVRSAYEQSFPKRFRSCARVIKEWCQSHTPLLSQSSPDLAQNRKNARIIFKPCLKHTHSLSQSSPDLAQNMCRAYVNGSIHAGLTQRTGPCAKSIVCLPVKLFKKIQILCYWYPRLLPKPRTFAVSIFPEPCADSDLESKSSEAYAKQGTYFFLLVVLSKACVFLNKIWTFLHKVQNLLSGGWNCLVKLWILLRKLTYLYHFVTH